jgi:serine/threonine protein kinase
MPEEIHFQRDVANKFWHDHLVPLLMTWTLKGRYNFLFPLSRYNLNEYWEIQSYPLMDVSTVRWMSKQIVGLASALNALHEPPSDSLDTPGTNKYWRHSDLNPESIMWYQSPFDAKGILVLDDFGLSSLNSIRTRSNESIEKMHGTGRYRPPEYDIYMAKVSRSCDIWTFGCLLLEWICWALKGQANRAQFLDSLYSPYISGAQSDLFFDWILSEPEHQVIVKSEVIQVSAREWVSRDSSTDTFVADEKASFTSEVYAVLP